MILIIIFIIFSASSLYFISANLRLKKSIYELGRREKEEFHKQVSKQKELIKKRLKEKYRQNMLDYQQAAKELEEEKNKARRIKEKLKIGNR